MKILILNWRDIKNPAAGGAEVLTHELAKRWVEEGHSVTQFSSLFKGGKPEENTDGITIVRQGHADARYLSSSVHFAAYRYYNKFCKGKIDVVVDEIHGLPFFTPLYVREHKVGLICEVADELWKKGYGPFFGAIGRMLEILYLRVVYKKIKFVTISSSTRKELINNGVQQELIHVIPMGITRPVSKSMPVKEKNPTLIYVGRLAKAKGIEDAIRILKEVKKEIADIKLWVVGRGDEEYTDYLLGLVRESGLENEIKFYGFVSEEKKFELMARAQILISPSQKEGFGLTVPEAGFVGTPSVVYDIAGLRDIIIHKNNGILCDMNVLSMSQAIIGLLKDKFLYKKVQKNIKDYAETLSFDYSSKIALSFIKN